MGLDIYVGSFTRYYAHEWETSVQKAGHKLGVPVVMIRSKPRSPNAITDPVRINAGILLWRRMLADTLRKAGAIAGDIEWDERLEAPYFTDKPDWDCFGALNLLAACEEESRPLFGGRFPKLFEQDWKRDARLSRRRVDQASRYSHLYGCEIWLPIDVTNSFEHPRPGDGSPVRIGSSLRLYQQMVELNERTYRGSTEDRIRWRNEMPEGDDPAFESRAKAGLSIVLELATAANEYRLPMRLDY